MSAFELFEPSLYTRIPNLDVPSFITLTRQ